MASCSIGYGVLSNEKVLADWRVVNALVILHSFHARLIKEKLIYQYIQRIYPKI